MEDAAVEYRAAVISFLAVGVLLAGCFVWSLVQLVRSKSPPRLGGSCERRLRGCEKIGLCEEKKGA